MAHIHPLTANDLPHLRKFWAERWGDDFLVAHGAAFHPENVSGFIALDDNDWLGLITYTFTDTECEIVSIDSLREGQGIGRALIQKVVEEARANQCQRVHVTTTNENLRALGFYQICGFHLSALRAGAVKEARKLKPDIPETGDHGIPIRDEIELEMLL